MSTPETPVTPTVVEPVVQPVPTPPAGATPVTEPLGEAGIAALKSEREARKVAEKATTDALSRVKEFEDRDKTETQKQADALAEIQRENIELKAAKTRAEVAEAKSDPAKGIVIPASLLSGSTKEELEASADALIAFRGEQPKAEVKPEKKTYFIPDEGGVPALDKANNITPGMGSLRAAYAQEKD